MREYSDYVDHWGFPPAPYSPREVLEKHLNVLNKDLIDLDVLVERETKRYMDIQDRANIRRTELQQQIKNYRELLEKYEG